MKKLITLVLTAVLAMTAVFGATSCAKNPTTEFLPEGEVKGELKLGFDASFPPYGYLDGDTNEYAGFDIELAKLVCNDLGYKLTLVPIDWAMKDAELESGTIDCIWNGFTIQGRESLYAWTPAYSDSSIVVLVKGTTITDLAGLAGKSVMVQAGSSGETALYKTDDDGIVTDDSGNKVLSDLAKTFKDGKFQTVDNYTNGFFQLDSGAIEALVVDLGVAKQLIEGKTGFVILEESVAIEQYGIGFKLGNETLRDTVWSAIQDIDKAEIKALAEKYEIADSITIDD